MPYVTLNDLLAKLPMAHLVDATDDDRDGEADEGVVTAILAQASTKVDSFLEQLYTVPIAAADYDDVMPSIVTRSALIFALVDVFARRGVDLTKDLRRELEQVETALAAIRDGEAPLVSGATASGTGSAILETSSMDDTLA